MYMYTQGHSRLISTGACIPEDRISSREIMERIESEDRFDVSYDWLERITGIKERRIAPEHLQPSDMAVQAAEEAMATAEIRASEIDAIIYAGMSRDFLEPATAHVVQSKIQAHNAVSFDITNACHGFMNGIHLMDTLIATGQVRRGLVVTGEKAWRYTKLAMDTLRQSHDRGEFLRLASGLGLGDAGAAALMGPKTDPDSGFLGFMLQSQAQFYALSVCGRNGSFTPLEADMGPLIQEGIKLWSRMYREFIGKIGWQPAEIAKCVQHQASLKMIRSIAQYVGVSLEVMVDTITHFGNLSTANIPFNLYLLQKNREVAPGGKVLLTGGGSGIAISKAALVWDAA